MKTLAHAAVVVIGLFAASPAMAEVWYGAPWSPFFSWMANNPATHKGPYVVTGMGNDGYLDQQHYWGGPLFVDYCGIDPPYQTYDLSLRPRCHLAHKRRHHRSARHAR